MLTNRSETSKEAHPKTDQSTGGNPNKKGSVVPSQAFFLITLSFLKFIVVLLTCAAIVYYGVLHTETIPIWIALPISFVIGLVVSVLFVFNDTARCVVALALVSVQKITCTIEFRRKIQFNSAWFEYCSFYFIFRQS